MRFGNRHIAAKIEAMQDGAARVLCVEELKLPTPAKDSATNTPPMDENLPGPSIEERATKCVKRLNVTFSQNV